MVTTEILCPHCGGNKIRKCGKNNKNHGTFAINVKKHSTQSTPITHGNLKFVKKS